MRWLMVMMVVLLGIAGWLWATGAAAPEADLRFISAVEMKTLDPQRITWLEDIRIAECLFEPLARVKLPEMTLEPAAAESWEISSDGLTYTFRLRPGAKWSTGEAVTASDFVYGWRRAILPDLAADYAQLLFCIAGAEDFFRYRQEQLKQVAAGGGGEAAARAAWDEARERFTRTVGLEARDERTLVVKLARPTPYFLELCAFITFVPVHEKTVEPQVALDAGTGLRVQDPTWTRPEKLVCNGPYRMTLRRFKRDILLEANDYYWNRGAMRNGSILMTIIGDPQTALLAYQRGLADWLPDIPTASSLAADLTQQMRAGLREDVQNVAGAGTYFYNFNCQPTLADGRKNPLSDARVRRALALAVDRATLVERVTRMNQPIARTFVPPGSILGYEPPMEAGAGFDPAAARKLLTEAGYPGGRGVDGLSILYNTEGSHKHIAQQIKRTWEEELGVVVTLAGVEKSVFGERLRSHDFTISRAGWFGDYRDPTTFLDKFRTGNGNNDAAWSDVEFDRLMAEADTELDAGRRMRLMREAEAWMLARQPVMPIYHYSHLHVYDPRKIQGLEPNAWNFRRLEFVQVKRGKSENRNPKSE